MSRRELKRLLEINNQWLPGQHETELDLNKEPEESAEITLTRRRGRSTLSQPNDIVNQGNDFDSEVEDNDSTSDKDYKPRKSGKRRVREHESGVDEANPIRRPIRLKNKRKNKKRKRVVRQTFVLSSNNKDKNFSLALHGFKSGENGSGESNEEIKENEALVVELGKRDKPQTKIENRVERLVVYLQDLKKTEEEMDIAVLLVSLDEQKIPNLEYSQLICSPNTTMESLCEYIALNIEAQDEEIELYVVKELVKNLKMIDPSINKVVSVNKEHDVGGLKMYNINYGFVLLGYRKIASTLQLFGKIGSTEEE